MIIVGYQGIGKSTMAGIDNCIDLESGNFWVNGERDVNWYKVYTNIATHLSQQGYTVFISSHALVREALKDKNERVVVIYPSIELKYKWIDKLQDRYNRTQSEKDYKALMNAKEMYDKNIKDLSESNFETYEIKDINYTLRNIINEL